MKEEPESKKILGKILEVMKTFYRRNRLKQSIPDRNSLSGPFRFHGCLFPSLRPVLSNLVGGRKKENFLLI